MSTNGDELRAPMASLLPALTLTRPPLSVGG